MSEEERQKLRDQIRPVTISIHGAVRVLVSQRVLIAELITIAQAASVFAEAV